MKIQEINTNKELSPSLKQTIQEKCNGRFVPIVASGASTIALSGGAATAAILGGPIAAIIALASAAFVTLAAFVTALIAKTRSVTVLPQVESTNLTETQKPTLEEHLIAQPVILEESQTPTHHVEEQALPAQKTVATPNPNLLERAVSYAKQNPYKIALGTAALVSTSAAIMYGMAPTPASNIHPMTAPEAAKIARDIVPKPYWFPLMCSAKFGLMTSQADNFLHRHSATDSSKNMTSPSMSSSVDQSNESSSTIHSSYTFESPNPFNTPLSPPPIRVPVAPASETLTESVVRNLKQASNTDRHPNRFNAPLSPASLRVPVTPASETSTVSVVRNLKQASNTDRHPNRFNAPLSPASLRVPVTPASETLTESVVRNLKQAPNTVGSAVVAVGQTLVDGVVKAVKWTFAEPQQPITKSCKMRNFLENGRIVTRCATKTASSNKKKGPSLTPAEPKKRQTDSSTGAQPTQVELTPKEPQSESTLKAASEPIKSQTDSSTVSKLSDPVIETQTKKVDNRTCPIRALGTAKKTEGFCLPTIFLKSWPEIRKLENE